MALTYANVGKPDVIGKRKIIISDVTFDSSYASGGESFAASGSNLGVTSNKLVGVTPIGGNAASAKYNFRYITSSKKLAAYKGAGVMSYSPGGGDIKGSTNLAGTEGNADQNATAVNGALLLAAATFTSLAGTMTPTAQPDVPRNIVIQVQNDSGGALNLYEGTTAFVITGTDINGDALTETVNLTSTSGNKSVADTKFRFVQGSKAFKTVTSVTYTNAPAGSLKGSLGVGSRLGLPAALENAVTGDVLSITVNAARVAPGSTLTSAGGVDTTNNTVNAGTLANGDDVGIVFRAAAAEVASTTDLSGVTVRCLVVSN